MLQLGKTSLEHETSESRLDAVKYKTRKYKSTILQNLRSEQALVMQILVMDFIFYKFTWLLGC